MGRYMRKLKGVTGEIAVMEVAEVSTDASHGRVTTRSQAALAKEKMKNRRRSRTTSDLEFRLDTASYVCTRRRMILQPASTTSKTTTFEMPAIRGVLSSVEIINTNSDPQPASCCSSNASGELFEDRMGAADPTAERGCGTFMSPDAVSERMGTVESRMQEESGDLNNSSGRMTSEADSGGNQPESMKMPSEFEIDEFFAAAEKDLHKRFSEKYNFDVVRDVPLEGRYEWVQVKP